MSSDNFQIDKENVTSTPKKSNSVRKSFGNPRQILNTSSRTLDRDTVDGLNDKLSNYIDYVRSVEHLNETLRRDKDVLIESFEKEIAVIKSTYGEEIDSLRKALDDVTTHKTTLVFDNKNLCEENEKLNANLKVQIKSFAALKNDYAELEEQFNKNRKQSEQYSELKEEHEELLREHTITASKLKAEVLKRAELENRIITLTEEIEFHKKINNNVPSGNCGDRKITDENLLSEEVDLRVAEEVENIKLQFNEDLEEYKRYLEERSQEKFDNLSKINENTTTKCAALYCDIKSLNSQNENLKTELFEKDNKIDCLNKRITGFNNTISNLNRDHENHVNYITGDNLALKRTLESKIKELSDISNEKAGMEKELDMFRALLEGEQNRYNKNDVTLPKRRKLNNDTGAKESNINFNIVAWSNERVKMFCDEKYDGRYIQILNDTDGSVNVNEWKIEIFGDSFHDIYTFPDRSIKPRTILKVWKRDEIVADDDENIVMNVDLPLANVLTCKLTNDMDGIEATFELRKELKKRKFLKAHTKKNDPNNPEKCSVM